MNPYQCKFYRICLTKPYFCVTKIHNPSLLTLWQTWNCWRRKIKPNCDQSFQKIDNNIKKRLHTIFSILNERGSFNKSEAREYEDECIENEEETHASTHFLRIQKKQLIGLMQHLERYTNTLPVFGFNSGRYDINLIKYYLIP